MTERSASATPPPDLLEVIGNLTDFHREHEKFYSQAPLRQAIEVQAASRVLKALADRWRVVDPADHQAASPFAGAEDLNAPGLVAESGVLFMEGEGEPEEIRRLIRGLETFAGDVEQTGEWLAAAMEQAWRVAGSLAGYPALADVLGERHRIVANDWQSAGQQTLAGHLVRRALELVARIDFSPDAVRADIAGERRNAAYLYSASELIDRAADLIVESATLVHDNERRWRVFRERVSELTAASDGD